MTTRRRVRSLALLLCAMILLLAPLASAAAPPAPTERILVRFAPSADPSARAEARANANASFLRSYSLVPGLEALTTNASARAIVALQNNPHVLYAEPDMAFTLSETRPNDPSYSALWGMENINAPAAWDVSTGDGEFVVAVIDTGVDYTHPDLAANMWTNPGEIPGNGEDDDGNGWVDDIYGYDFFNGDADPIDDHNHGTHCSGTIGGGGDNGEGWPVGFKFMYEDKDAIPRLRFSWDKEIQEGLEPLAWAQDSRALLCLREGPAGWSILALYDTATMSEILAINESMHGDVLVMD